MVQIKLDESGLVPAIAQHHESGEILMMGYMNPGSIKRTFEGGEVWFYSRSRSDLWHKGEMSGNYMRVKSAYVDCDGDTMLLKVDPDGPICHTGNISCFFTQYEGVGEFDKSIDVSKILEELFSTIQDRKNELPTSSYTTQLIKNGPDRVGQKVIEEAGELAIAGVKGEKDNIINEMADLMYHSLVLLAVSGLSPKDVWEELRKRRSE